MSPSSPNSAAAEAGGSAAAVADEMRRDNPLGMLQLQLLSLRAPHTVPIPTSGALALRLSAVGLHAESCYARAVPDDPHDSDSAHTWSWHQWMWFSVPSARLVDPATMALQLSLIYVSEPGRKRTEADPPDEVISQVEIALSELPHHEALLKAIPIKLAYGEEAPPTAGEASAAAAAAEGGEGGEGGGEGGGGGERASLRLRVTFRPLCASELPLDVYGFQVTLTLPQPQPNP